MIYSSISTFHLIDRAYALFRKKTGLSGYYDFSQHLALVTERQYSYNHLYQVAQGTKSGGPKLREALIAYLQQPGTLGAKIRFHRKSMGLTLKELGHRSSLSISYLSDIELDKIEPPLRTLRKIADGLGISLQAILDGIE